MQSENTARAPRTMSNWPLVRNLAVTAPKSNFSGKLLSSDLTKETVEAVESGTCPLDQLPGKVPNDVGR